MSNKPSKFRSKRERTTQSKYTLRNVCANMSKEEFQNLLQELKEEYGLTPKQDD
jgi:ribosomal protein L29